MPDDVAPPAPSGLPSASVLSAFGLYGETVPLPGGEGRSVRVGREAVLKPVDDEEAEEARWRGRVLDRVCGLGVRAFRVPRPLRTATGDWIAEGWTAAEYLPGTAGPAGRWSELLYAGREFHRALSAEPRPDLLDRRTHPWAVADRVAWGEQDVTALAPLAPLLQRLCALRKPVGCDPQIVHGDLTGNVLFADGEPPVIVDFSPYWRPVAYADAIVVADALLYHGADRQLLRLAASLSPGADLPQMLVRALLFRLATLNEASGEADEVPADEVRRFAAATELCAPLTGAEG